jgi:hypothetical protein
MWATEDEKQEQFYRETTPDDPFGVYYHPGGCKNCGDGPCYMQCPNHPGYYSPEQEREDSERHDAMSHDEWFREGIAQWKQVHGEDYVS